MGKSVRIDVDDLEEYALYTDEQCEKLEAILRSHPDFEGCVVKRMRAQETAPELKDPFDVATEHGDHLVWFYEWQLEALDDDMIPLVAQVDRQREKLIDSFLRWTGLSGAMLFCGVVATAAGAALQDTRLLLPLGLLLLPAGGLLLYFTLRRKRSAYIGLDVEVARNDSRFLEALRRLAALSDSGEKETDEYRQRVDAVETALMGV